MRRRRYLALSCTALTAATVAGCTGGDDGNGDGNGAGNGNGAGDENGDGETPTATPVNESAVAFRSALEDAGFEVLGFDDDDGVLTVDYASSAASDEEILDEGAEIMELLAAHLDEGWDLEWLEVWLVDDGAESASYTVLAQRIREWSDGELSDEEFFDEVRDAITHY